MKENMKNKIISIDEDLCIGCEACVNNCNGGALEMVDGKAKLTKADHCDYLGMCLPVCPTGAISFVDKEQDPEKPEKTDEIFNEKPVMSGCPGRMSKSIIKEDSKEDTLEYEGLPYLKPQSMLRQWPVQIKLVQETAAYFDNANLLIAADCTAFAYGNFHEEFIKNSVTLIGCPKLDEGDYTEKLQAIIENNNIKSLTVVRMEVPCCGGIEHAAKTALQNSKKFIPWSIKTITIDGKIL